MMNTVDYRRTGWGHSFHTYPPRHKDADYRVLCWNHRPIRVGDEIIWKTEYGYAVLEVLESEWAVDPSDMYRLEVRVVRRYDDNNVRLDG